MTLSLLTGVSSVPQNAVPVQPIASTSAAPVEYASSANSGAATFVGSNQGRAYIAPAPAASACPNVADSVVPISAPAIFPPYPPLADFGGYIASPDASNFGDGMGFNPNFDFNNFDNFDFNFEWSLLPDDLSLLCQRRFFLLNGTPQISGSLRALRNFYLNPPQRRLLRVSHPSLFPHLLRRCPRQSPWLRSPYPGNARATSTALIPQM